ncbi:MAG: AAA family ATPase [Sulfurovum sp.]
MSLSNHIKSLENSLLVLLLRRSREVLKDILKENLYEAQNLLYTELVIKEFQKRQIHIEGFLEIIEFYIANFNFLKYDDTILLKKLYEKLVYFNEHSRSTNKISLYKLEIASCITFITRQKEYLFNIVPKILNSDLLKIKIILNIDTINIKNFFSITDISLDNLKDKKEIYIVGENGDGKTLLLQAIAVGIKGTSADGLQSFREIENTYTIEIENKELCENNFLAYGALRNSVCQMKEDKLGFLTLFSGEFDLKSPIDWLLTLDYSEKAGKSNIISVKEAKKLLQSLLNSDIQIDITPPNQVTFTEKGSIVDFKQLSAGYKGVITIVCDLIDRLSQKQQVEDIKEYQGIVLIDEVELHLHPKWSYGFMKKLRDIFPLIQFIVTTHSPTVILGASKEAVFYKIYKDEGEVRISNQMPNRGYTNNSLISSPLFDPSE